MLKWIGGCLVAVVVVVAIVLFIGYRKLSNFAAEGPSSTITIDAPPSRVFASLANADSLTEWRAEGLGIRASRRGILKVGDTLQMQVRGAASNREQRSTWTVTAVIPGKLLAMEMRADSGKAMATRRDSIVAVGDSTLVVITFTVPFMDSVLVTRPDSGGKMAGMASKLMIGAMRMQSGMELTRLKNRIEGRDTLPRPARQ